MAIRLAVVRYHHAEESGFVRSFESSCLIWAKRRARDSASDLSMALRSFWSRKLTFWFLRSVISFRRLLRCSEISGIGQGYSAFGLRVG